MKPPVCDSSCRTPDGTRTFGFERVLGSGGLAAHKSARSTMRSSNGGNALLRREAALALGAVRDATVVAELRAIVGGRGADVDRATAAVCLGRIGSDGDIDFLLPVLADRKTSDPLRPCIVHAPGWLIDRTDYGRLASITGDVKWDKHVNGNSLSRTGEALCDLQHIVD